jgi:Fe-S cluster assembly protein SufD
LSSPSIVENRSAPIPTGREEAWRFTPLSRLGGLLGAEIDIVAAPRPEVSGSPEVIVEWLSGADIRRPMPYADDLASLRAWENASGALVLTIPAGLAPSEPLQIVVRGAVGVTAGEIRIVAERSSRAVVVIEHVGVATRTDNVVVTVGEDADLTVVTVQNWERSAIHLSTQTLELAQSARLRHFVVTLGGDVVRIAPRIGFTGPGAQVELLGLFFADAGQHQENRLHIDHSFPHCSSEVVYKGALRGASTHTVWIGDVLIRPTAIGTKTYEVNRNLVLGGGARADSVPNLEIETGEVVGAGHASATGRFDDEQLFYLQSRGIPSAEARRLVVRGFFADLLARVKLPELEARLLEIVDAALEIEETA